MFNSPQNNAFLFFLSRTSGMLIPEISLKIMIGKKKKVTGEKSVMFFPALFFWFLIVL